MNYPKKLATGDAGQNFVAYKFSKTLGWPCRLYGSDIGIDGELEILNDDLSSTGDFIKLQIKSSEHNDSAEDETANVIRVYVSKEHIDYWKNLSLPVVICYADLKNDILYWKKIELTKDYSSSGAANVITINKDQDRFTEEARPLLAVLGAPAESKNIADLFQRLRIASAKLPRYGVSFMSFDAIDHFDNLSLQLNEIITEIKIAAKYFPWRISETDEQTIADIEESIRIAKVYRNNALTDLVEGS